MPFFSIQSPSSGNATQLQGRAVSATAPSGGQVLGWDGSAWVPAAGVTGPTGSPGVDAPKILNGTTGPVSGYGRNGDFFIDTNSGVLYGPRTNGAWGNGIQLQTGQAGPTGPAGVGSTGPASTTPGPTGERGPTGATGAASSVTGPPTSISIGSVTGGPTAAASVTGAAGQQLLSLVLPQGVTGATGATGPANSLSIGTVSVGAIAAAALAGSPGAQVLSLVLPPGPTGVTGAAGAAPQLAIGNVDNASQAAASIVSQGGGSYLVNFSIPPGPTGSTGAASTVTGPSGPAGPTGSTGPASTVPGPSGVLEYYATPTAPIPTRDGAVWLDTDDGRYYTRYNGLWIEIGVQGEQGPTGPSGVTGATGAGVTGPQGGFSVQQSINARTASYTLTADDAGKLVTLATGSGSLTVTIPATGSAALPVGTHVDFARLGAATVAVTGASGVTVNATPGKNLRAQYSSATAIHYQSNVWLLVGDLSQ